MSDAAVTSRRFVDGVHRQPDNLRDAGSLAAGALGQVDLSPFGHGTLVLTGVGASWFALLPIVRHLQAAGRRAFAVPPQAVTRTLGDAFVLVSQSGASTETMAAFEAVQDAPTLALTSTPDGPLARAASAWLPVSAQPDTPVSTVAYTGTLQALALLGGALTADRAPGWSPDELAQRAARALDHHATGAEHAAEHLADARSVDVAGANASAGSAGETALLFREGLRTPATGEETRQYLHGPLEAVAPGFGAIVFGDERELALADTLAGLGAAVVAVSPRAAIATGPDVHRFAVDAVPALVRPILEILPVQLTVAALATRRGLPVDALRQQQADTKL
jgi:glutamine---fructose-6-phosphate transaminase (isomerizing)